MSRTTTMMAAAILAIGFARPARAMDIPDLRGRWNGFTQGLLLPAVQTAAFDVFNQKNRRFEGTVHFTGTPDFHVVGTLSAANIFNIQGRSMDGMHVTSHGRLRLFGDGSVRFVAAAYKLFDAKGKKLDEGHALLAQMFGGMHWDDPSMAFGDVNGLWMGPFNSFFTKMESDGTLDLRSMKGTSAFLGAASFFDVFFDLQGSVGPMDVTDGTSNTLMFGVSPNGIIAILIGLLLPAVQDQPKVLDGTYHLWHSFFDVFTDFMRVTDKRFDAGMYRLPAVQ